MVALLNFSWKWQSVLLLRTFAGKTCGCKVNKSLPCLYWTRDQIWWLSAPRLAHPFQYLAHPSCMQKRTLHICVILTDVDDGMAYRKGMESKSSTQEEIEGMVTWNRRMEPIQAWSNPAAAEGGSTAAGAAICLRGGMGEHNTSALPVGRAERRRRGGWKVKRISEP